VVQNIALGYIKDIHEDMLLKKESIDIKIYEPKETDEWNCAFEKFC
jgi:hypothetical protein